MLKAERETVEIRRIQKYIAIYSILIFLLSSCLGPKNTVGAVSTGDYFPFKFLSKKTLFSTSSRAVPVPAFQTESKHIHAVDSDTDTRIMKTIIPPLLIFLLGISSCDASVLNPQPIAIRGPFFQGWLMRTVDHDNSRSFILIIGSFSGKGSKSYDEHYIFCGIETEDQGTFQFESFPKASDVTIEGSAPSVPSPFPFLPFPFLKQELSKETNITWSAKDIGHFKFNDQECTADFRISGSHIKFSSRNRLAWSKTNTHSAGPEGWLGYTSLLPCHYFVHSVGSECEYSLFLPPTGEDRVDEYEGDDTCNNDSVNNVQIIENDNSTTTNQTMARYEGKGFTHIEGNHGTFFPSGWVWSQSILKGNEASFSLTGGKFEIGVFAPITFILFVRIGNITEIFRTTSLDRLEYDVDGIDKHVKLTAHSLSKMNKVDLLISLDRPADFHGNSEVSVKRGQFGEPLYIPTSDGFKNIPGCLETYTAYATIILSKYERKKKENSGENSEGNNWGNFGNGNKKTDFYTEIKRVVFPLTALEFGGSFQGVKLKSGELTSELFHGNP